MAANDKALLLQSNLKDRVDLNASVGFRNIDSFTFEAWVKVGPNSTSAEQRAFMMRQGGSQKRIRFAFTPTKDMLRFELARTDGSSDVNYTYVYHWDDRWHHCAFAVNGPDSKYEIILDGAVVQEGALTGFGKDGSDNALKISDTQCAAVYIGATSTDATNFTYWDGKIDNIRLWKTARSSSSIQSNMFDFTEDIDSETNLYAEWRLEDTSSSTITGTKPSWNTSQTHSGTMRRNGSPITNLWTDDRPFLGEGAIDTTPPTQPATITATNPTTDEFQVEWSASTDNVYVQFYELTVATTNTFITPASGWNAKNVGKVLGITVTGLTPGTNYWTRVRAIDSWGNASEFRTVGSAITTDPQGDYIPPTAPTLAAATSVSATQFAISWSGATDTVGVTGYKLDVSYDLDFSQMLPKYRNRNVGNITSVLVNDGVPPQRTLYVRVRAYDASENESPSSNIVRVVTPSLPDIEPPSAVVVSEPTSVDSTRFIARWMPASDNIGVVGYLLDVARDYSFSDYVYGFHNLDVGNVLAHSVTGLTAQSSYFWRVRAYDAAGNVSANTDFVGTVTTLPRAALEEGVRVHEVLASTTATYFPSSGSIMSSRRDTHHVGTVATYDIPTRWYPLNERLGDVAYNSGGWNLTESSGSYRGTFEYRLAGPSETRDDVYGVQPTSASSYIDIPPYPIYEDTGATIVFHGFWIKLSELSEQTVFYADGGPNNANAVHLLVSDDGEVVLRRYDSLGSLLTETTSSTTLDVNTWTHVGFSRTAGVDSVYIGSSETTGSSSDDGVTYFRQVRLANDASMGTPFTGVLSSVTLGWEDQETSEELVTNYQSSQRAATALRFSLGETEGVVTSLSIRLPIITHIDTPVRLYRMENLAWDETSLSGSTVGPLSTDYVLLPTFGSFLFGTAGFGLGPFGGDTDIVRRPYELREVDISSLMLEGETEYAFVLIADDTPLGASVLGGDRTIAPSLVAEIDVSQPIEPRTIEVVPRTITLTNLVLNPSVENGWSYLGADWGGSSGSIIEDPYIGSYALRVDTEEDEEWQGAYFDTVSDLNTINQEYFITAAVRAPIGQHFRLSARGSFTDESSGASETYAEFEGTGKWLTVFCKTTFSDSKMLDRFAVLVQHADASATTFDVDAVGAFLLSEASMETVPYFDGDSKYASWLDEPHNSPSQKHVVVLDAYSTYIGDSDEDAIARVRVRRSGQSGWNVVGETTLNNTSKDVSYSVPPVKWGSNVVVNPSAEIGVDGVVAGEELFLERIENDTLRGIGAFRMRRAE